MSGRPPATWLAILGCGCEAPVPGEPAIGSYLTCINDLRHQTSYRVNGKRPIVAAKALDAAPAATESPLETPARWRSAVQLELWGAA